MKLLNKSSALQKAMSVCARRAAPHLRTSARTVLSACAKIVAMTLRIGFTLIAFAPNCATISFIAETAPATALGCLLFRPATQASSTPSALSSHSTSIKHSSIAFFFVPARDDPKTFLSMIAEVKASLALKAALFPPNSIKAVAASIPFSCATAFESSMAPRNGDGSRIYGVNTGSSSLMEVLKA